jgi:hypothetical protein
MTSSCDIGQPMIHSTHQMSPLDLVLYLSTEKKLLSIKETRSGNTAS